MMEIGEKVKIVNGPDEGKTGVILEANLYHQNYMVKVEEPNGSSKFQRIGAEALVSLNPKPVPVPVLADITPMVKQRTDIPEETETPKAPEEPESVIQEAPKVYSEPAPTPTPEPAPEPPPAVKEKLPRAISEWPAEDIREMQTWIEKTAVKAVEVYIRARLIRK